MGFVKRKVLDEIRLHLEKPEITVTNLIKVKRTCYSE